MDFPVRTSITVRYRDLDPMGHVNNAVYASYLEWARVIWTRELARAQGREIPRQLDARDFQFIVAEVTITYRSPAYLGEALDIGIGLVSAGRSSFVFEYAITERESGRLVATGRSVQVMFDYAAGQKMAIPDAFLDGVAKLQGAGIPRTLPQS